MSNRLDDAIVDAGGADLVANADVLVLLHLAHGGPARPTDLQRITGLTSGGMTKLLDRLEQLGVAGRAHDVPGDRRGVAVALTAGGRRRARRILDALADALEEVRPTAKEVLGLLADVDPPPSLPDLREVRSATSDEIVDALGLLGTRLNEVIESTLASADSLRPRALTVLCLVADEGSVRPTQVMDYAGMSSGGVTKLLDQLEARGLVTRAHGADDDRRAIVVRLTDPGAGLLERVAADVLVEGDALVRVMALVAGPRSD